METSPVKMATQARLPKIGKRETFDELIHKLAKYFIDLIDKPISFEEFRTSHDHVLSPLSRYLLHNVTHPALIAALLALKGNFVILETSDEQGIHASRGFACEAVALRFITGLADREIIDFLLYELQAPDPIQAQDDAVGDVGLESPLTEQSPLLSRSSVRSRGSLHSRLTMSEACDGSAEETSDDNSNHADQFEGLNALEIAAVAGAKKFLAQKPVQRIVEAIWYGDIVFWAKLTPDAVKKAQVYQRKSMDPYCRLRVPIYVKAFEVVFFIAFLAFYYMVLIQRSFTSITTAEVFLYIWIASFAYNEIGEFWDAGTTFYLSDFWSAWDVGIVAIGFAFFITRIIGLQRGNEKMIDTAFDILSLEALFLIPRICSLLSLNPYFGTLIPCLTVMTKDFLRFLSLVIILYLGFLTTFCLLARGYFTFKQMSLIVTKVFFGSSYLGFDVAEKISPVLGLPLMLIFICLTQILLITSLISILSNSLSNILSHAREEYLYVYAVFVLEASTSSRLTYFLPPLNLVSLAFRPMRLILTAEQQRYTRITVLKMTHLPHVAAIGLYERLSQSIRKKKSTEFGLGSPRSIEKPPGWRRSVLNKRLSTHYPLLNANSTREAGQAQATPTFEQQAPATAIREIKAVLDQLTTQIDNLREVVEEQERQLQAGTD